LKEKAKKIFTEKSFASIVAEECPADPGYVHSFKTVSSNFVICTQCRIELNFTGQIFEVKELSKEEAAVEIRKANSTCLQTLLGLLTGPCRENSNQEEDHQAHHCFHDNGNGDAAITRCWCGFTVYDDGSMWKHTRRELKEDPFDESVWIN
jgi:hypothetical protein